MLYQLYCHKSCIPPTSSNIGESFSLYSHVAGSNYLVSSTSLQCWNGTFFDDSSLHVLGQQVNLGHEGLPCPQPLTEINNFTVVDVSGIHSVTCAIVGVKVYLSDAFNCCNMDGFQHQ